MTSQLETEALVLHTVESTSLPQEYAEGSYRNVVGLEVAKKKLWLPGTQSDIRREEYEVPKDVAHNTMAYVEQHYIDEAGQALYRNCHLGAAAMTGLTDLEWYDACDLASRIVFNGQKATDLEVGQWGAIGDSIGAYHSMIGLAPGLGIQTDSERGPFSVVSHAANLDYYHRKYGTHLDFFALHSGNPKY